MRLLASDIDGTLLRSDGTLSARTRDAIGAAAANGVEVVLVTGRPPRYVHGLAAELGVGGEAICANGALTWDLATERPVEERDLPARVARLLVEGLRRSLPGVQFAGETGLGVIREPDWESPFARPDDPRPRDGLAIVEERLLKLLVRLPGGRHDRLVAEAVAIAGRDATVTYSAETLIEVSGPGVTKGSALGSLCRRRGIAPAEVVAFGDMPNDADMLRLAGRGIAVANAHAEAIAAADELTASNDEDGVAAAVERLLGQSL